MRIVLINHLAPGEAKEHSPVIALCALLLTAAGAALIYLASAHQGWRAKPLPATARLAGWLAAVTGCAAWLRATGTGPGVAAALSTLMLAWIVLPYAAWWRAARKQVSTP
jgi:hypothetical protein